MNEYYTVSFLLKDLIISVCMICLIKGYIILINLTNSAQSNLLEVCVAHSTIGGRSIVGTLVIRL